MRLGTGRYQVGSDGEVRSWMLLGTRRYQVGSNGEARSWMLLGTRRYQVGSDVGSSIADASSKLAYMDAFAVRSRMLWEPENCFRYSIAKRGQWRRSLGARRDRREIRSPAPSSPSIQWSALNGSVKGSSS